jgi:crotonobetainyl-CoA:carnitine CoA-transferase CaiB-like acyl-CoA transferase
MGFGFEALRELRPDIILASGSGWGREGPWADRGGYDHVAQALSGVMSEQGSGRKDPQALIAGAGDRIGGMMLAFGIASALFVREQTGQGQHIDVSLLGSLVQMQNQELSTYLDTGEQSGFQRYRSATYTHYECGDGEYVALAANTQEMWENFCDAIERPDLKSDPRFAEGPARRTNKDALVAELTQLFLSRPAADWTERLAAHDVPHAPVLDYAGVVAHPQFYANDYIVEVVQEGRGTKRMPGPPVHMSFTPPRVQGWAPTLGEHTDDVLREVGYSTSEIEQLRAAGAV